ncbi:probable RNA-binding protein CG14230 [Wyeomyia smithii]|uniref:probable RNA-binding protein CG14230 n=1 Tax=Wyeomyia smithii TaxID=174621 RepID=UPI002467E185|nr:probable RNA-binding protein CG14230 [Wyeomyia smithii]
MPVQRLFVGNIPQGTSEQELKQEFSAYGPVTAIDLKCKPNPLTNSVDTFAFVNIELDERAVRTCINEFRQEQYKGVYLNVSKAKESFLDRLKREREEAEASKQTSELLNPYKKNEQAGKQEKKEPEVLPVLPTIKKNVESSSSESSSESEDEQPGPVQAEPRNRAPKPNEEDQIVRKWNQETYLEHGKLKIVPITGQVKEVIEKGRNRKGLQQDKELSEAARQADEKRKRGLTNLQSAYEQQKQAIKAALAGAEASGRKKIVFDDDDDEPADKRSKLSLFDNEADEEDGFRGNFSGRLQQVDNSEEGQRLFEMQTQFYGDSRFKLDERFLGDEEAPDSKRRKKSGLEKSVKSEAQPSNLERKKQLEILSKVTGKDIQDRSHFKSEENERKVMQRFDPSAQVNVTNKISKKEKKPSEEELLELKKAERPAEDFKVTDEKYYKVSDSIKEVIGSSSGGGFSLLGMFGSANPADEEDEMENVAEEDSEKPVDSMARFKYESSASEDEDTKNKTGDAGEKSISEAMEENNDNKKKKKKSGHFSKPIVWRENFFFLPGDARQEEGKRFFCEFANPRAEEAADEGDDVGKIRKIYKKRKMRETKNVNQIRARRGLKLMHPKRK